MKITMTLREILHRCKDWDAFCDRHGYSVWCVKEGGGDYEIVMTEDDLIAAGITLGATQ